MTLMDDGQDQRSKQKAGLRPQWKPGQSGNPAGRPKGKSLLAEIRDVLDGTALLGKGNPGGKTTRRMLAEAAVMHAIKGRSAYFREIMERLFGKVPIRMEQRTEGSDDAGLDLPDRVVAAGLKAMLEAAERHDTDDAR